MASLQSPKADLYAIRQVTQDAQEQSRLANKLIEYIAFQINILAQTSEVSKTSEVFRARHFSENL
jgi:hypothetical protein